MTESEAQTALEPKAGRLSVQVQWKLHSHPFPTSEYYLEPEMQVARHLQASPARSRLRLLQRLLQFL